MKTYPYQDGDQLIQLVEKHELDQLRAANAELLERLAEARESHLAASARDVQTIQRQAIMLERLADAARRCRHWHDTCDGVIISAVSFWNLRSALSAYESANPKPVANAADVQTIQRQSVLIARLHRAISVRMCAEEPTGEERLELMHAWEEAGAFLNQSASSVRPNAAACGQCADKALTASATEAR